MRMLSKPSRILALDWDRTQLRYLLVNASSTPLKPLRQGSISIDESGIHSEHVVAALRSELQAAGARGCVGIACSRRASMEELDLQIPSLDLNELPELIVNQSLLQSNEISDKTKIDFLVRSQSDSASWVRAYALHESTDEELRTLFQAIGVKLKAIVPRELMGISLFAQSGKRSENSPALVINRAGTDLELSVVFQEQAVYSRTIHFPDDWSEEPGMSLLAQEIRRTIAVMPQQEDSIPEIQSVHLLSVEEENSKSCAQLSDFTGMDFRHCDFSDRLPANSRENVREWRHFGALIAAAQSLRDETLLINFQRVRKATRKTWLSMRSLTYGALALGICVAACYVARQQIVDAEKANEVLSKELAKTEQRIDRLKPRLKTFREVATWQADRVAWLDELFDLTQRLPDPTEMMVQNISFLPSNQNEALVVMNIRCLDQASVAKLENAVRDEWHSIQCDRLSQIDAEAELPWQFEARILIKPRQAKDFPHFQTMDATKVVDRASSDLPRALATDHVPSEALKDAVKGETESNSQTEVPPTGLVAPTSLEHPIDESVESTTTSQNSAGGQP
jgi:hypothetical protein